MELIERCNTALSIVINARETLPRSIVLIARVLASGAVAVTVRLLVLLGVVRNGVEASPKAVVMLSLRSGLNGRIYPCVIQQDETIQTRLGLPRRSFPRTR